MCTNVVADIRRRSLRFRPFESGLLHVRHAGSPNAMDDLQPRCYACWVSQTACRGLVIEQVRVEPRTRLHDHAHEWACMHWITAGVYKERDPRGRHRYPQGALFYKPPQFPHDNVFDEGSSTYLRLQLPIELVPERARHNPWVAPTTSLIRALMAALWAESRLDCSSSLAQHALACDVISSALGWREPTGSVTAAAAHDARIVLERRFAELLSFTDIAAELGVRRETLARAFHRRFGMTMGAYQRRLRVARALELVDQGASWAAAAAESGFSDQAHLSRVFRATVGVAPSQWRALLARNG